MLKTVTFLRKKPGMSTEAFREYYEQHHRLIGEKYLAGLASRYVRRYLNPQGQQELADYDVILEIWFADEAAYQACGERLGEPSVALEIAEDEKHLFERSSMRSYTVNECESTL